MTELRRLVECGGACTSDNESAGGCDLRDLHHPPSSLRPVLAANHHSRNPAGKRKKATALRRLPCLFFRLVRALLACPCPCLIVKVTTFTEDLVLDIAIGIHNPLTAPRFAICGLHSPHFHVVGIFKPKFRKHEPDNHDEGEKTRKDSKNRTRDLCRQN